MSERFDGFQQGRRAKSLCDRRVNAIEASNDKKSDELSWLVFRL